MVPWLNQCPDYWQFKPLKYLCRVNQKALPETTDPDYQFRYIDIGSVGSDGRYLASDVMVFGDAPSRARRIVQDGDVLVSTVRTYLRAITYLPRVEEPIVCSTGFAVLSAGPTVYPGFLAYWVRSNSFVDEIVARSVGVSYPAINSSDIGNLPFPCIPIEEQRAITTFLNRETERIDTLIAKKERQVELLQEKRAALISQVVTKGLNPGAKMKDCEIVWLGKIPEHWEKKKFSRVFQVRGRIGWRGYTSEDLRDKDEGVLVLGATNIDDKGKIDLSKPTYVSREKYEESPEIKLKGGELLIVKVGATIGKVGLVPADFTEATINPNLMLARSKKAESKYFFYFLHAKAMQAIIGLEKMAGAQDAINQEFISNLSILFPPIPEQSEIAEYLDRETDKIDRLVDRVEQSIDNLKEYRTALISTAVTGKIDVRKEVEY
jgi:type I restriction enzyme S subunit